MHRFAAKFRSMVADPLMQAGNISAKPVVFLQALTDCYLSNGDIDGAAAAYKETQAVFADLEKQNLLKQEFVQETQKYLDYSSKKIYDI